MKQMFCILVFFLIFGCSSTKQTFWCGDHACTNKKEKEAYFNKTMIVEIKEVSKDKYKKKTNLEIIREQNDIVKKNDISILDAKIEENILKQEQDELVEQAKIEEELIKQEQDELVEQAKIEEKLIKQEQDELVEQAKIEEELIKQEQDELKKNKPTNTENISKSFDEIVKNIRSKNSFRPYPDINDIPN